MIKLAAYLIIGLIASQSAAAIDYVPPPPGPYKSNAVISRYDVEKPESEEVYRFPSEDFLRQFEEERVAPVALEPVAPPMPVPPQMPARLPMEAPVEASPDRPAGNDFMLRPEAPQADYSARVPGNPWGTGQPYYSQPQYGYDTWGYQPYNYPGNYPYQQGSYPYSQGYGENNPFNTMPSPWSMMPMQNFFSDKK